MTDDQASCELIRTTMARVGEKWPAIVLTELRDGPLRFNELRRAAAPITQRMLTVALRGLERDGLVDRTVHPTVPPQVEYTITAAGTGLHNTLLGFLRWAEEHGEAVRSARAAFSEKS